MTDMPTVPAGWYPDYSDANQLRYWDGSVWTEHRAPMVVETPSQAPTPPVAAVAPVLRKPKPAATPSFDESTQAETPAFSEPRLRNVPSLQGPMPAFREPTPTIAPQFDSPTPAALPTIPAPPASGPTPSRAVPASTWVIAAIFAIILVISLSSGIGAFLLCLGLIALFTGAFVLRTRKRSWALLPTRASGAAVLGAGLVVALVGVVVVSSSNRSVAPELAGSSVSQSGPAAAPEAAAPTADPAPEQAPATAEAPIEPEVSAEFTSALSKAGTYSSTLHMSKAGLYDQLTSEYGEKFSPEAGQYAVDNLNADWNANALAKAKTYQETMSMSPEAIRDQLTSAYGEQFTQDEADYAILHLND